MKIRQFVVATRLANGLVAVCIAVLLAGCASESSLSRYVPQIVTPYRIDIQQGNFITPDMLQKLAVGQTREQVRFILGTPLLVDIFRANRWDYVFRSSKGWNEPEKRKLIVFFDASGRVERWEADLPPAVPAAPDKPAAEAPPKVQAPAEVPVSTQAVSGASNVLVESVAPALIVATAPAANASAASSSPPVTGAAAGLAPAAAESTGPPTTVAQAATPAPLLPPAAPASIEPAAAQVEAPAAPALVASQASAATPALPPAAAQVSTAAALTTPGSTAPSAILSALEEWRAAWARRDVDRYLSMYAADFAPPAGLTRAQWEAQRRLRLQRASFIVVNLLEPQISVVARNAAIAVFTQVYESDAVRETGRKTLALVQADGRWRIRDESFRK